MYAAILLVGLALLVVVAFAASDVYRSWRSWRDERQRFDAWRAEVDAQQSQTFRDWEAKRRGRA